MKKRTRKNGRPIQHAQWIEITRENGKTVSTPYPPNAEFERLMLDMDPKPDLLYRYLNFIHGVPTEYNWIDPTDDNFRVYGGLFLQRVLPSDWPYIRLMESLTPGHHVLSAPNPQPRPAAWGPCPCPRCTAERETGSPSRFRNAPVLYP
jgi:hypothetical protein